MDQNQQQIIKNQEERLKNLRKSLYELYFLSEDEIETILGKMKYMPPQAFVEINQVLQEAKAKQDDFLGKEISQNPAFVQNLNKALGKKYQEAADEVSNIEHLNADKLLNKLKDLDNV